MLNHIISQPVKPFWTCKLLESLISNYIQLTSLRLICIY